VEMCSEAVDNAKENATLNGVYCYAQNIIDLILIP
jgi:hypothetical protein